MKIGKVEKYINDFVDRNEPMLLTVIDPLDHPSPEKAAKVAKETVENGASLILVGGSIGAQGEILDSTIKLIKEEVNVPINLFPGNVSTVSKYADSIYFMSMLNSRNSYWTTMAQTIASPVIKQAKLEPLPTGYIVVAPGGTVGWVGDANLVPRHKPQLAAALALGGQMMGNRLILTDCGSASKDGHMPLEMVAAVRKAIDVPYIVGGGIRTPEQAKNVVAYGADAIQIGTAFENESDIKKKVTGFVKAIKEGKKKK